MGLIWGKITVPTVNRTKTNVYPDTVEDMIIAIPAVKGKGFSRKFVFNNAAQEKLDLHKQVSPEVVLNDKAIYSFDAETKEVYIGIYNKDAFASIERIAGEIPTMQIGKTTMGFSSKELYTALEAKFGFEANGTDTYFELQPVELEGAPVQMYKFVITSEVVPVEETETSEEPSEAPAITDDMEEAPEVENVGENAEITMN